MENLKNEVGVYNILIKQAFGLKAAILWPELQSVSGSTIRIKDIAKKVGISPQCAYAATGEFIRAGLLSVKRGQHKVGVYSVALNWQTLAMQIALKNAKADKRRRGEWVG